MQSCLQLLLVFVSYSTLVLRSLCQTINPHPSLNPTENRCSSFTKISNLVSILSTLLTRTIPTSKILTIAPSSQATSSITTYRTHCGAWLPLRCSQASSFDGPFHPPTHRGHWALQPKPVKTFHKVLSKPHGYTVQQKPFIRFPHLPNRAPYGAPPPIAWTTTVRLIKL